MSEEKPQATTETVSESPATEAPQVSPNDELIAESKKYRKRAQDAEARLAKYEKAKAKAEEDRLKEKEEFKTLYEKASSDIEGLTANAEKWTKYEEAKRVALLESHPEDERESLAKLDLETLEYVTGKISSVKNNAPEVVGMSKNVVNNIPKNPFAEMDKEKRAGNWDSIVQEYADRHKKVNIK
tara:strand:- start:662 stop:1213 length:552 start_codon:yes stop_codon:yes gene_type:complete